MFFRTMLKLKAAGVVVAPKKTPSSSSGGASGGRGDGIVRGELTAVHLSHSEPLSWSSEFSFEVGDMSNILLIVCFSLL